MNFGKIDNYVLLGGGQLLCELSLSLSKGGSLLVVTSQRHAEELVIGKNLQPVSLKDFLNQNKIEFLVSEDINKDANVHKRITKQTLGVSISAAWIFKDDFIRRFEGRLVNLHGARLPQDRGGGGFSWRILRGERLGYALIHEVDPGVDTGVIVKCKEYFFPTKCRIPIDYQQYSVQKYLELFTEFIAEIRSGKEFEPVSQPEYLSVYWPRLDTDTHGYIDWNWKLRDIEQFICAFDDPYKGARTLINGSKVRVKKCLSIVNDGGFHPFQKGIVYRKSDSAIFVATEDGSLVIQSVKDEEGNELMGKINVGDRFHTPSALLEEARQFRAVYNAAGLKKKK